MSQLIGKTLGPYQVMLHIRSTHTNAIYKAFDTRRGQYVALQVILPDQNEPDWSEVPEEVRQKLRVHFIRHISQLLPLALHSK